MSKIFVLRLDSNDLGQILEGLQAREESWRRTAEYLRSGYIADDFVVEECNNGYEANCIASHYCSIIATIRKQQEEQS